MAQVQCLGAGQCRDGMPLCWGRGRRCRCAGLSRGQPPPRVRRVGPFSGEVSEPRRLAGDQEVTAAIVPGRNVGCRLPLTLQAACFQVIAVSEVAVRQGFEPWEEVIAPSTV